ncbi:MAG: LapA family protein [Deltaproteobacteria bacterium]|nr:LapA family protein [Deltaproteobacteria bacterium]
MNYAKLTAAGLVLLSIVCFTVQNSSRTTDLSLDLYLGAWKLVDPAPIPMLMWGSFALGALAAWLYNFRKGITLSRRVRQLEQEMALAGRTASASPHSSAPSATTATRDTKATRDTRDPKDPKDAKDPKDTDGWA